MKTEPADSAGDTVDIHQLGALADRLASHLSHELRTPLSAILLWSKILGSSPETDPQLLREGLESIEESVHEQEALINEFVDLARILTGKFELKKEQLDALSLIREIARRKAPAFIEQGLRLELALDPNPAGLIADQSRLEQAITLLLDNAIKSSSTGGKILLQLKCRAQEIEIQVRDSGTGLSADEVDHIFERFSPDRTQGGLGLDLPVAHRLIALHNGTLTAASPGRGKGSTFTIRLPLAEPIPS